MKHITKFLAVAIFLIVTPAAFFAGIAFAGLVGNLTNSGLFGICGPYGPHAGLVGLIFLGTLPASLGVGIFSARRFYRKFSK